MNSGGRYNPVTNGWQPTSTSANVPDRREQHTAVWTGTEMIVWGGVGATDFNTGGRYNPAEPDPDKAWTPTYVGLNVPPARSGHTAVWTGSEMIVWGVVDNKTWRYYPDKNDWVQTTPRSGAPPSTRSGHTAIWDGTEMIVWGGLDSTGPLQSGGNYTPGGGWISTTPAAAPTARRGHTAIWTGTNADSTISNEMIVWGGQGCEDATCSAGNSRYLDSGGRYTPGTTDTWQATAVGGFSSEKRSGHSAVWAGSYMIVWGGRDVNGDLSSGGLYSPSGTFILSQPQSMTVAPHTGFNLSVSASGTGLTYQWQLNGVNLGDTPPCLPSDLSCQGIQIFGSQTSSLSVSPGNFVGCADPGNYQVLITNSCATTVPSAVAIVSCIFN